MEDAERRRLDGLVKVDVLLALQGQRHERADEVVMVDVAGDAVPCAGRAKKVSPSDRLSGRRPPPRALERTRHGRLQRWRAEEEACESTRRGTGPSGGAGRTAVDRGSAGRQVSCNPRQFKGARSAV